MGSFGQNPRSTTVLTRPGVPPDRSQRLPIAGRRLSLIAIENQLLVETRQNRGSFQVGAPPRPVWKRAILCVNPGGTQDHRLCRSHAVKIKACLGGGPGLWSAFGPVAHQSRHDDHDRGLIPVRGCGAAKSMLAGILRRRSLAGGGHRARTRFGIPSVGDEFRIGRHGHPASETTVASARWSLRDVDAR